MIIKDRLIQVDVAEALAIAGKGETVRCVGEGTGLMTITDALEGLTFFAPESALTEEVEPVGLVMSKDEVAKLEKEIAKLDVTTLAPVMAHFDTPEERTRAILGSVERYDEEHDDPPTVRVETAEEALRKHAPKAEKPKAEAPMAEALTKEYSGEEKPPVPFTGAPSGGALKK